MKISTLAGLFLVIFVCFGDNIRAQSSLTGTYRAGDPNVKESAQGLLEILETSPNQARFSLTFSDHGQSSQLTGTLMGEISKGQLVYFNDQLDKSSPCTIVFQSKNGELILSQDASSKSCGLAAGLDVSGSYQKISDKPQSLK
jgi:hypothetical protein